MPIFGKLRKSLLSNIDSSKKDTLAELLEKKDERGNKITLSIIKDAIDNTQGDREDVSHEKPDTICSKSVNDGSERAEFESADDTEAKETEDIGLMKLFQESDVAAFLMQKSKPFENSKFQHETNIDENDIPTTNAGFFERNFLHDSLAEAKQISSEYLSGTKAKQLLSFLTKEDSGESVLSKLLKVNQQYDTDTSILSRIPGKVVTKSILRSIRGQKCLAIGTIIVQMFTVIGIVLSLMRNWSVIETFFKNGKPPGRLGDVINKIFNSDEITMLGNETYASLYMCQPFSSGDTHSLQKRFSGLSLSKQALILTCNNIDVSTGEQLMTGEGFRGFLGEQRREDILIHKEDLIGKFVDQFSYAITSRYQVTYVKPNMSHVSSNITKMLKHLKNIANKPMFLPINPGDTRVSPSHIMVIRDLKTLGKFDKQIDKFRTQLLNRTFVYVDKKEWIDQHRKIEDKETAEWIHSEWEALERVSDQRVRPKERFDAYEEMLFDKMDEPTSRMNIGNDTLAYHKRKRKIRKYKAMYLIALAKKEKQIENKILKKVTSYKEKKGSVISIRKRINKLAKIPVDPVDPHPYGLTTTVKKMIEIEISKLLSNDPIFRKRKKLREYLEKYLTKVQIYIPTTTYLSKVSKSLDIITRSIDAFSKGNSDETIKSLFSIMRAILPIFESHGAGSGALCSVGSTMISILYNQPIITELINDLIDRQTEYVMRCSSNNCLTASQTKFPADSIGDLKELIEYQNNFITRAHLITDAIKEMHHVIRVLNEYRSLIEPFHNREIDDFSLNLLLLQHHQLEIPMTLKSIEYLMRLRCIKTDLIGTNSCKELLKFYIITSSLLDIIMFNTISAMRLSPLDLFVSSARSQFFKQRTEKTRRFLKQICCRKNKNSNATSCNTKCSPTGNLKRQLENKWMFEYIQHLSRNKNLSIKRSFANNCDFTSSLLCL